jgi:outer membrane protein assembly factor BamB
MTKTVVSLAVLILFSFGGYSQEVQWRGPKRDGIYPDRNLLKVWPEMGPELVLKKEGLGEGWSTPVISEDIIYISGRRDSLEALTAVRMDGSVVWESIYGKSWESSFPDTRNSPTIEGGKIYISGAMGKVNCIDKKTGKIIWEVNTHEKYKGEFHRWGMAESLILTDDAVISSPVGSETVLVALYKKDGSLKWKTESIGGQRSYASPLMITYNGVCMILAQTSEYLVAVDPDKGEILWKYDLVTEHAEGRRNNTNTPLYQNGEIFTTSGYDAQAVMLQLADDGKSVKLKWTSDILDTHHGGDVLVDGYIYGSNWVNNGNGNWVCLDWETGEAKYEEKWFNKGPIIYADGFLYIYDEKQGNVGLVKADPENFNVASSFKVEDGTGPHWAHPSIYNGYLLIRHGDVLLVYDIKKER